MRLADYTTLATAPHARRTTSRAATHLAVLLTLTLAIALVAAPSALAITRATVLSRAQSWVDHPVVYSQSKFHLGYRTDCSGYVSMCWSTGESYCTANFNEVTRRIPTNQLRPGDALLRAGYHIRLFHNWADAAHTSYVAYEAGSQVAVVRVHSMSGDLSAGYVPVRYNGILDGPAPDDAVWNGSFDAWLGSGWDQSGELPVMWEVDGPGWQQLAVHHMDVAHSSASSIEILNPGEHARDVTDLSQLASATPGAPYRLTAWLKTAGDPSALSASVAYLDASGTTLAETRLAASDFAIDDSGFKPVSAVATAPEGTINALVSIRLTGGATEDGDAASAFVDDVSLVRPRAALSIQPSASTARVKKSVAIAGSVTPTCSVGVTAAVYIQKPHSGWKLLANAPVTASGTAAVWNARYAFKRGMRKGTYKFRTMLPGFAGYLGATSKTVSIKLK